jgi:DNA repair protein RecN (Recombination protein N)
LLDSQAGLLEQAREVAAAYKTWRALARQREQFELDARNVLLERERLEWQVAELHKLAVKPGEWAEISVEHSRLSHAAALIGAAQEALGAISESESPILSQLSSITQKLGKLVDVDTALKPVLDAGAGADPAAGSGLCLNDYLGRVELDPRACRRWKSGWKRSIRLPANSMCSR